jgi:hypothetical protein
MFSHQYLHRNKLETFLHLDALVVENEAENEHKSAKSFFGMLSQHIIFLNILILSSFLNTLQSLAYRKSQPKILSCDERGYRGGSTLEGSLIELRYENIFFTFSLSLALDSNFFHSPSTSFLRRRDNGKRGDSNPHKSFTTTTLAEM